MLHLLSLIDIILVINGLYDLTCACAILFVTTAGYGSSFFSRIHLAVFTQHEHRSHPVIRRLIAYWVLTYGLVRLAAGAHHGNCALEQVAALTYFVEAACYHFESVVGGTMSRFKAAFVSILSIIVGSLIALAPHCGCSAQSLQ